MKNGRSDVSCDLCSLSIESEITGPLSTKNQVTAHQNCLLYSSGIYSKNSPEYDELFGFSVEDVQEEVKRGRKLYCHKCKKKGATAGCEEKRCKKSFHYPCAVEEGARIIEDSESGNYGLYCRKHQEKHNHEPSSSANPATIRNLNEAGTSKRRLRFSDEQGGMSATKRNRVLDSSSNSDDNDLETAPLEFESANSVPEQQPIGNDSEMPTGSGSENESRDAKEDEDEVIVLSDAESQSLLSPVETSKEPQSLPPSSAEVVTPTISTANPIVVLVKAEDVKQKKDGGCRPEQRLVHIPGQHTVGTSVPQQSCTGTSPSPDHLETHSVTGSPPCNIACVSPDSPKTTCITVFSSSSSSYVTHSEPSIDSVSFWKSCTMAGCTQAIFADFINEMNNVFSRIQSNQASQEDYDLALRVMASSGKLFGLVDKQQKELHRKQGELKKAAAALKDVVSALRR